MTYDAALVFHPAKGWHLQPSPELEQLVASKQAPPPVTEEPDVTTSATATAVVTVARSLRDGLSIRQIAENLGLTENQVRDLARDIPGLQQTRPAPAHPAAVAPAGGPVTELPTAQLREHPDNLRSDLGDLTELQATIRSHGILQALLVHRGHDGRYIVLDGHRRLAAALLLNLPTVPVTIRRPTTAEQALEIMLITGAQKLNLSPLDEAAGYQQLIDAGYSQGEIAQAVGKNQGHISQRLALLLLTPAEQAALRDGGLNLGDAYRTGRDRSSRRRAHDTSRPKPKKVLHYNQSHPLAAAAGDACRKAGHEVILKLGPACGPCWEAAIRRDALAEHAIDCPAAAMSLDWDGAREQQLIAQREDGAA